jgi:hypothetical protein
VPGSGPDRSFVILKNAGLSNAPALKHLQKMKPTFLFLFLTGFGPNLPAQCPVIQNCLPALLDICDFSSNDDLLWHEAYWHDPVHNTTDLCEAQADLSLIVVDTCGGAAGLAVRYRLFLDLDGDGIQESVVDSDEPNPVNTVYFNNASSPVYTAGEPRAFDQRPLPSMALYGFGLGIAIQGNQLTARVIWTTDQNPDGVNPQLPAGAHRLEWQIGSGANLQTCSVPLTVRDCKPPLLICYNGLSVNIMPTGMIMLDAENFLDYMEDNCTPAGQLQRGIRKAGTGTGFPVDAGGSPVTQMTYNCNELGVQLVELWGIDRAGNADYCQTYVLVQDNIGACQNSPATAIACLRFHCDHSGIGDADVQLTGWSPGLPPLASFQQSGNDGCADLSFPLPPGSFYTVQPLKESNPLNGPGVNMLDMIRIQRHILGLEPLDSPFKLIAADINGSGSVTLADIVYMRKILLGIYQELPAGWGWRFIPAAYNFPDPANPFQPPYPQSISFSGPVVPSLAFVGVRVGDLECGNAPAPTLVALDRQPAYLQLPDRTLRPGETMEIPLQLVTSGPWLALQAELAFDPSCVGLEAVRTGAWPELDDRCWALPQPGRLSLAWLAAEAFSSGEEPLATLRIRAKRLLRLSQVFRLTDERIGPQAYSDPFTGRPLELRFKEENGGVFATNTTIYRPEPNPTGAGARIPLLLAEPAKVVAEWFDPNGRLVYRSETALSSGTQAVEVPAEALTVPGMYSWRVRAGRAVANGKLARH